MTTDPGGAAAPPVTDAELRATVDHAAIERLQRAYADLVTRHDWPALADLFLPDAVVDLDLVTSPARRIEGPEALGTFIAGAIERFSFFEFVILNTHVELATDGDPDRATARVFMCELRQLAGEADRTDAFGLYRDAYRRVDGRWRIAHRHYRSMGRFPPGDTFPLPTDLT